MIGVGIDIESIDRIAKLVKRYDRDTLTLLFTPEEIDRCESMPDPARAYTVCFCAKEAVGKALGTGLADINWNEIETTMTALGNGVATAHPHLSIQLSGAAHQLGVDQHVQRWTASWSSWDNHVLVHVLKY